MRRCARFHANAARRQIGKELKNSPSTNTLANDHRAICINTVNLKQVLGDIQTDGAKLTHGRLPSMWFAFRRNYPMALRCRGVGAVHHISS
jgi:hypothetical protein